MTDICAFIEAYYKNFPFDLSAQKETLFGSALAHWRLAESPDIDTGVINVFNPSIEHHGWVSPNTIIHVVIKDIPFLMDSIKMELVRLGCTLHSVAALAGVYNQRDSKGRIKQFNAASGTQEAFVAIEVSHLAEAEEQTEVENAIRHVIDDVTICVDDWEAMKASMQESIDEITNMKLGFDEEDVQETKHFLEWLLEYFTFMGARQYDTKGVGAKKGLYLVKDSGLGVLRDDSGSKVTRLYSELPPDTRKIALSKQILMISKTNTQSTVHRPSYTDVIGIKRFNKLGKIIGEKRFIGLFTSDAYDSDPSRIPILRKKVQAVILESGLSGNRHASKRLMHILKNLPRDELLQIPTSELCAIAMGILELQDKRKVRLFARRDIFNRFISCLVYVPRDNFNTELRIQIQDILLEAFSGLEISATPSFSESPYARVHFIIRIDSAEFIEYDFDKIEEKWFLLRAHGRIVCTIA